MNLYIHEQIIVACAQIGRSIDPPMSTEEIVSEMNHAAWEMLCHTQPHIDDLIERAAISKATGGAE